LWETDTRKTKFDLLFFIYVVIEVMVTMDYSLCIQDIK